MLNNRGKKLFIWIFWCSIIEVSSILEVLAWYFWPRAHGRSLFPRQQLKDNVEQTIYFLLPWRLSKKFITQILSEICYMIFYDLVWFLLIFNIFTFHAKLNDDCHCLSKAKKKNRDILELNRKIPLIHLPNIMCCVQFLYNFLHCLSHCIDCC